jgi:heavy metal sensor kinase
MRLPIRTRLTLVFAGLMLVVLTGSGILLYRGIAAQLDATIDEDLNSLANELAGDLSDGETDVLHDLGLTEAEELFGQILDREGNILESSRGIHQALLEPTEFHALEAGHFFDKTMRRDGDPEAIPARFLALPMAEGPVVLVGFTLVERNATLERLAILLWVGGPLLFLIVSGLAWFMSGAALRPVERLRRETALISESDLEKRLPVPATGDEIAGLATTLNEMLARLQQAFERERRFVDDASHELRTPLGILRTELELAQRRSRTKEELEAALASAAEETERLNRLAEDLLVLARADRGRLPLHKTRLDPAELARSQIERFKHRAGENGIMLDIAAPNGLAIDADALRLQQAVGNLLDNAIAHTPKGGRIRVSVAMNGAATLTISVADTGQGFPDGFLERAFAPFTRADTGRSRRSGGAGLGLAIVKGVVDAHGGMVEAANLPAGGAIVTMRLPA